MNRCFYPATSGFSRYGAAGITVCERWRVFTHFLEDMGLRPEGKTLHRTENSKGYEPGNCEWATPKRQAIERSTTNLISVNGVTLSASDWSRRLGGGRNLVDSRIELGWSPERAVTTPIQEKPFRADRALASRAATIGNKSPKRRQECRN